MIQTRELRPGRIVIAVAALLSLATMASTAGAAPTAKVAAIEPLYNPHPKSRLECEHQHEQGVSWRKCFSEPPGSSCAHPLEVWRSGNTTLGDGRYFTVRYSEEPNTPTSFQTYSWRTKPGVAICPHGVFYHVARYLRENRCTQIHGDKYCTGEADNKIIPAESGRHGGTFYYELPNEPPMSFTLVIRGYFVHPHQ